KKRQALLTFVIVGAGPTGVEFAGALAELIHHVLVKDYPELPVRESRIILVEAGAHMLTTFAPPFERYAPQRLQSMGVEVRGNAQVDRATPESVHFKDGSEIATHTLFWSAGVRAVPLADALAAQDNAIQLAKGKRIKVAPDFSLPGHPEVFVIGDM